MKFGSDITGVIYYRGDILVFLKNTLSPASRIIFSQI